MTAICVLRFRDGEDADGYLPTRGGFMSDLLGPD